MGQKVNPHGIRVGVIKDWDSRWFASKKDFSDNLVEDHKIRTELKAQLKDAGVPKIEIERTVDPSTSAPRVNVNIYCAKPGMVIGKGGEERIALQNKLTKEYGKTVIVNVIEVKSPSTNAQLVAEDIARQLENRVTFRRAMRKAQQDAMRAGAKGIRIKLSGRLGGAEFRHHNAPRLGLALQPPQDARAVQAGQHRVQHQHGGVLCLHHRQRLTAVGSVADQTDIPLLLQEIAQLCPIRLVRIRNAYSDLVLHIHFPL